MTRHECGGRVFTELPSSATVTTDNLTVTKVVVGSNKIATTGTVTYRTTIAATGAPDRLVNKIVDVYPGPLGYVAGSATATSWQDGQMKAVSVDPIAEAAGRLAVTNDVGWVVSAEGNNREPRGDVPGARRRRVRHRCLRQRCAAIEVSGQAPQEWPAMGVKIQLLSASTGGSSAFGS